MDTRVRDLTEEEVNKLRSIISELLVTCAAKLP